MSATITIARDISTGVIFHIDDSLNQKTKFVIVVKYK